ncbi:TetR/AcrR family transcriptional regulator [Actinomadura sp. NTSP31]|uniref:TetR/AcrR family transcriptional regulator n=1 Tax=Actinomadura sp. NTSP31 TaxID=1735447 RepID=UPI0035C23868
MAGGASKASRKGERSREAILDAAERLMAARGYAATSISAICKETGLPATSIYWHFNSKEGLLAAVMERGAARWFAALPRWESLEGDPADRVAALMTAGADAVAGHPGFLRLFYLLALDDGSDAQVSELVRTVRARAFSYFQDAVERVLALDHDPQIASAAAAELSRFAVAASDGFFFALQLEPNEADIRRLYGQLVLALQAVGAAVVAEITARREPEE